MTSSKKPSAASRLKALAKEIPDDKIPQTLQRIYMVDQVGELQHADHVIALIGGAFVDHALETAIVARFIPMKNEERKQLFDYNARGPISDFSARIKVGWALGLYGTETRDNLDVIREIRNAFAHTRKHFLRFETPEVAELCASLTLPPPTNTVIDTDKNDPTQRYLDVVAHIPAALKKRIVADGHGLAALLNRSLLLRAGLP